ncbi:MAG: NTP transferase domain-containing protein [Tropicimonas sp.]|uniref:nucleotidyltransferase family protein n=1 Tax=Tropicimonas sp. TaxID=2067044 RepID=UPI003A88910A
MKVPQQDSPESPSRIPPQRRMIRAGLVLAAGRSSRFGPENKLLHPFRGRPLAAHAAASMRAADLDRRIAVVCDDRVAELFDGFEIVRLAAGDAGQSDSLRAGVRHAVTLGAERLLVALADMPHVPAALIDRVVGACRADRPSATTDGRRRLPPACFPQAAFGALERLTGDRGAGALLRDLPPEALVVAGPEQLTDVDRQEDIAGADGA